MSANIKKAAANCTSANCGTVAISEQQPTTAARRCKIQYFSLSHLIHALIERRWLHALKMHVRRRAPSILSDRERALLVVIGYFSIWSCMHACFVRKGWERASIGTIFSIQRPNKVVLLLPSVTPQISVLCTEQWREKNWLRFSCSQRWLCIRERLLDRKLSNLPIRIVRKL